MNDPDRLERVSEIDLHCPLCGTVMERTEGTWYCPKGEIGLPKLCRDAIHRAICDAPTNEADELAGSTRPLGGYCPKCGQRFFVNDQGKRICKDCKIVITGGVFFVLHEHVGHKSLYKKVYEKWRGKSTASVSWWRRDIFAWMSRGVRSIYQFVASRVLRRS